MKLYLVSQTTFFMAMCAFASPENPTRDELLQTVRHISQLAKETQTELDDEKSAHTAVANQLQQSQEALDAATKSMSTYQAAVEAITNKANAAIAAHDKLVKELHLAKWIMCGLAVAAFAFLALKLMTIPVIGQYAMIGAGAAAVATCSAIWIWV